MKIPMLHQTDLFHPHNDPDDHWDLACVFALAMAGKVDLKGILIDYPPANMPGDPDVMAVSQLNYITGLAVPVIVGTDPGGKSGIDPVIGLLKNSSEPIVINIVGSCRDIAIAAAREPQLFETKCKALYLNAGTGARNPSATDKPEYNVSLNASSYASLFKIRCPIYWMPCFENVAIQIENLSVMEYGTFYKFRQDEILPHLSLEMQNYFSYMLSRSSDPKWLRYLSKLSDAQELESFGQQTRLMWCTGGFLHAAGYSVTREGEILPIDEATGNEVFTFDPIEVSCDEKGVTRWSDRKSAGDRFIFHVRDTGNYSMAMTKAMEKLLKNGL